MTPPKTGNPMSSAMVMPALSTVHASWGCAPHPRFRRLPARPALRTAGLSGRQRLEMQERYERSRVTERPVLEGAASVPVGGSATDVYVCIVVTICVQSA